MKFEFCPSYPFFTNWLFLFFKTLSNKFLKGIRSLFSSRFFLNISQIDHKLLFAKAPSSDFCDQASLELTKEIFKYPLGEKQVDILFYTTHSVNDKITYFHPHASETTSLLAGLNALKTYGGDLLTFDNDKNRTISFSLKGVKYEFDPNSIFSRKGIIKTLKKFGTYSKEAENIVYDFSKYIAGLLNNDRIVSLLNLQTGPCDINIYLDKAGNPIPGIRAVHKNEKQNPYNFIYTTNGSIYNATVAAGLNAVLQGIDHTDKGKFKDLAMKNGIDFSFIENRLTDVHTDHYSLDFINRFYNQVPIKNITWEPLKPGDLIDLIAPSSAYPEPELKAIVKAIQNCGFKVRATFANENPDALDHSNTDSERLKLFLRALRAEDSKAVWCIRGGEGCSNFLNQLLVAPIPKTAKPIIGFSDITGIHLFINSKWNWPSIHGVLAEFNKEINQLQKSPFVINDQSSIQNILNLLSDQVKSIDYSLYPMNDAASITQMLETRLIGGNLTLVTTSLTTSYRPTFKQRTLILEDIGSNPHQLERMLDQIAYSEDFGHYHAIILGDILVDNLGRENPKETQKQFECVLENFAQKTYIPVFRLKNSGGGSINNPLPLNTKAKIHIKNKQCTLTVANR